MQSATMRPMPRVSIYLDELALKTIRSARQQAKLTMDDLATSIGCSWAMIQAIELGNKRPSADMLTAICDKLNLEWREQSAVLFPKQSPPKQPKKKAR